MAKPWEYPDEDGVKELSPVLQPQLQPAIDELSSSDDSDEENYSDTRPLIVVKKNETSADYIEERKKEGFDLLTTVLPGWRRHPIMFIPAVSIVQLLCFMWEVIYDYINEGREFDFSWNPWNWLSVSTWTVSLFPSSKIILILRLLIWVPSTLITFYLVSGGA